MLQLKEAFLMALGKEELCRILKVVESHALRPAPELCVHLW